MKIRFLLASIFFLSMQNIVYADTNPMMSRVYGNQFTPEIAQTRSAGQVGALDFTFNGSNSYITPANGLYAYAVQALSNGAFVTVSYNASNTYLTKYNAEGSVITSGFGTAGVVTLTGLKNPAAYISIDAQGRYLVSGYDDTSSYPWIRRITTAGVVDSDFSFTDGATWGSSGLINQLAQQTTGKIIAVGFNGANAMVARYNLDGTIDNDVTTGFGVAHSGYAILNGSSSFPTSTVSLYSVVVDTSNNVYIAYVNATPSVYVIRLTSAGIVDTTWNSGNPLNLSYLNPSSGTMVTSQLRMIIDSIGNLVVAVPSGTTPVIKVASIATSTGTVTPTTPGTFVNVTMSSGAFGSGSSYDFRNMMATSNGSVYFIGSNTTTKQMMVARFTTAGVLDTAFNSNGVNFFNTVSSPTVNALLYAGTIGYNGEMYVAGSQSTGGGSTITPYISRLYNTQYVTQTAQFPAAQEQGILDQTFGTATAETYPGVTALYNGLYSSIMMQHSAAAIEVRAGSLATSGDILVGLNGLTSNGTISSMMFGWLTQAGAVDTSVNTTGYLTLDNQSSGNNEYITSMLEDGSGNIYVSGYTSTSTTPTNPGDTANLGALMRVYTSSTSGTAAIAYSELAANSQAVGISLQPEASRSLLCVAESATAGHISGISSLGILDTTFGPYVSGSSGPQTGEILSTSYGLHMGPSYGLLIDGANGIFAGYLDSTSLGVCVAAFLENGSGLNTLFGTSGVAQNLFSGYTIAANSIRLGFRKTVDGTLNILVGATGTLSGTQYLLVTSLDLLTGHKSPEFNSGSTLAISTSNLSTTALHMTKTTGVDNGASLLTFWGTLSSGDQSMFVARITQAGALDTTFNSQGTLPGILPISIGDKVANYYARVTSSALVQSTAGANKGNIVVVGYESMTSTDATPMALRSYGTSGTAEILDYPSSQATPGTLDVAFNLSTAPNISTGFGSAIFVYPAGNSQQTKLLLGTDNGISSIISRVDQADMILDANFGIGGSGKYTIPGSLTGITHISLDANNNILVGGTNFGTPWAQLVASDGSSTTTFNLSTAANIATINNMYQQKSGRYIIAATGTGGQGLLIAFQDVVSAGSFQVDRTFNPLLTGGVPYAGCYYVGTTGLFAMAINANDTIVVAYKNGSNVMLSEITADGNGLVSGFNSGSAITTGVTADNSGAIRLNLDGAGNIIVGGSVAASHQVTVQRFDSAGGTSTAFTNGGVVASNVATITNLGSAGVTLTQLMETTTQQTVLVGYNTAGGNGKLFAVRLAANGQLDGTWNAAPVSPDTAGVLTYGGASADNAIVVNAGAISINGTIMSIGSTNATVGSSVPVLTWVYGDNFITGISQDPLQSPVGTLDLTIPGGSTGSLALASLITGVPARIYIYNGTVNSSPNGAMLIASTDSTHVYVKQLNADLSVNTNFATSTSNVVTFSATDVTVTDLYVANGTNDTTQPIYVVGYTSGNAQWAARIAVDGSSSTVISPVSALTATGAIRQSTNSRVLISGYNGSSGAIVAYNSAMTAIDTSFGNNGNGYYTTGVATGIYAMAIDNLDRIYIAYANAGGTAIIIERLLENGTAVDTTFTASFPVTGTYPTGVTNQIKMAIDLTHQQIVVVAQNGTGSANVLQVARLSYSGGTVAAGAISTITMTGKVLNISDLFIDSNQFIYVVGNNSTDSKAIVARIVNSNATTIALDPNYAAAVSPAPAGIANLVMGSMTATTAGMLDPDGRVYLVGSGSGLGYMGRIFNNQYYTEISNAILQGVVGKLDLTLSASNTGGIDLSATATTSAAWNTILAGTSKAQAIIENSNGDGSLFIAFVVSGNLIVGKLNADMKPATFGTNGLTTTSIAMASVNAITQDAAGNIIVIGTTSGGLQKAVLFTSAGIYNAIFNAPAVNDTLGTVIGQQKSGRYILGGYSGANGIVSAYKNASAIVNAGPSGALPADPTFGPAALNGYFSTGINGQIDDLVIDSNDYIYIVYRNGTTVNVAKLTPEGALSTVANTPSAQVWSTNPITATGITSASQPARIAINAAGNILVGASTSTPDVKVVLYNGSTGAVIHSALSVYSTSTPVLTKLVGSIASTNEFYGSIYTSAPTAVLFAITSAGVLDTTGFNASSGFISTNVQSVTQVNGLAIQPDGKVVMVGYNGTGSPDPILIRMYGYPYVSQYAQAPDQVGAGILDTTLWPTSGALDLDGYSPISTTITTLNGSSISRIYEYTSGTNSGKALLVFSNTNSGADTVVARVNKDLTLDTAFGPYVSGSSGPQTGFVTITGENNASSLFIDSSGNIYVAGGTTTSWIRVYNNAGTSQSGWSTATPLTSGAYQVAVQSTDRTILAGKNTNGTLYGYNTSGVLDATFGASGIVDMGTTDAITDFVFDSSNRIIAVKLTSNSTVIQRVPSSGVGTITTFTGSPITTANGNAKVVLDSAGSVIVASATTVGFTLARYNNDTTGTVNGSQVSFSIGGSNTSVLGNIYATSDGKITLVGYETTGNKVVVARLISSPNGTSNANLVLDTDTFNSAVTTGVPGIMETVINSVPFLALDAIIGADDRIMIAGSQASDPYLARVFGDTYVSYLSLAPTLGVAGTLNSSFGNTNPPTGTYNISTLNAVLSGAQGKAIFPLANGGYYMAFDDANSLSNSILIKTLADGSLDSSYNTTGIATTYAPLGVNSIFQDGLNKMLLVGTTGGAGWVQRYTSTGVLDSATFGAGTGKIAAGTVATVAVEQTLARLVVAGFDGTHGALFAYTSIAPDASYAGTVDTTFNAIANPGTGIFVSASTNLIPTLIADQYDRLIFAVLNNAGTAVDLYRLTPTGELDATFGTSGKKANVITSAAGASSVRVAINQAGNIVVVANSSTINQFSVNSFDNGILTTTSGNGLQVAGWNSGAQLNIDLLTGPSVTALLTSSDGCTLILGNQSGTGASWIARITSAGILDTTNFNSSGTIPGIFQYTGSGTTHIYDALALNSNGTLGMLGYETSSGVFTPTLVSVYDNPYVLQISQTPDSKVVGTNDATLGVGSSSLAVTNGINFFGDSSSTASYGQVSRAIGLFDDNNLIVAIDGNGATSPTNVGSQIYLNKFDTDGLLNTSFGSSGHATILNYYNNQYVKDMLTFTTITGIHKALIAGYVSDTTLGVTSSLLMQYNISGASLDTTFGGLDGNPSGIALADGKQAFVVGQQSLGRIIVGGLSQNNLGLLLGYTANGKLDTTFGNSGYQVSNTGSTGIYSHAIDAQNRIVIAYNDGSGNVAVSRFLADGSGLDTSFNTTGSVTTKISGLQTGVNNNFKVVVDGSGNVIVAAITGDGSTSHIMTVYSYASDGASTNYTATFTAGTGFPGTTSSTFTMSTLLVDIGGKIIIVAYDSNPTPDNIVIIRLVPALTLDTSFNGSGYLTYHVSSGSTQVATDAMIHPDGRIIVVGDNN